MQDGTLEPKLPELGSIRDEVTGVEDPVAISVDPDKASH